MTVHRTEVPGATAASVSPPAISDAARATIDTPALVVDIDRVDAAIERMATVMRERRVALRPHAKTHKSVEVGRRQVAAGAAGLTVGTIGEAETFVDGGIAEGEVSTVVSLLEDRVELVRQGAGELDATWLR